MLLGGCTGNIPESSVEYDTVAEYLNNLPTWVEFSPERRSDDSPLGGPSPLEYNVIGDTLYTCSTTPRTVTETPGTLAVFAPDEKLLWLGALLQGDGHRDGISTLRALPIHQRAPLTVSIDIPTPQDTLVLDAPNAASAAAAMSILVSGSQPLADLGSDFSFDHTPNFTFDQAMLHLGLSPRYVDAETAAALNPTRVDGENTVMAYFVQEMYTTSAVLPQTPAEIFSEDYTGAQLEEQEALGHIGADNPPTFVSSITWGRMLLVTMTSTHSAVEMSSALSAQHDLLGTSGTIDGDSLSILATSRFAAASVGGDEIGVAALLGSGRLSEFFDDELPLAKAHPVAYTVRHLGDALPIATVSETTDYDLVQCTSGPVIPTGGEFALTLDSLELIDGGCDEDILMDSDPAVYYTFETTVTEGPSDVIGTQVAASTSGGGAIVIGVGDHISIGVTTTYYAYLDGRGGITVSGNAWDHDTFSVDDWIGEWVDLGYDYWTPLGPGYYTRSGDGCTVRLHATSEWLGDRFD